MRPTRLARVLTRRPGPPDRGPAPGRRRWLRPTRGRLVAAGAAVAVLAALVGWAAWPSTPGYTATSQFVTVMSGPAGDTPIRLDTTYYRPRAASAAHPVAAVLLAHGFGGTKESVRTDAQDLAGLGYAVLTWTAEGFGRSGGQIHLDSPDWEVKDASRLLDWLAARTEVRRDGANDPRVAAVGGSYGGGLALLLAGYDHRVDAIVPQITWNDLASAFLPESTGRPPAEGVFKKAWAGLFFGAGAAAPDLAAGGLPTGGLPDGGLPTGGLPGGAADANPICGRFAADICQAYLSIATTGRGSQAAVDLLRRSSPASVLDRIDAPTLLVQGEADSLFPLAQAQANARGIAAHGTPVRVAWFTGGHDGGTGPASDQDRVRYLTAQWLDHYLRGNGPPPPDSFTYSRIAGLDANSDGYVALGFSVADYPGLSGNATRSVPLRGPTQPIANPPNGTPGALSILPGTGTAGLSSLAAGAAVEVPGQHADFYSAPLTSTVDVVGAPVVRLRVASLTGEAVLFVKLYDVDPSGGATLPDGLVAPVHLSGLPRAAGDAAPVTVTLPAIVHQFQPGHLMRITVASSDQAYATPPDPTLYTVALGGPELRLPTVHSVPIVTPDVIWRWLLAGLIVLVLLGILGAILIGRYRFRNSGRSVHPDHADTPLVVSGLRKEYGDGFIAVSRVDFTVHRGQVVGLLGPNGAGKTTALRVLLGLTHATAGEIYIFGHRLAPGAPVLSRIGALVEGPGFLPHVSGLGNLRLYWRATGRPEAEAHFEEALAIAGLGDAIHRRVRKYSHGMRQRLAIAQAMLGLPELLVLDEPTDGLDPPQIAEMRRVLHRYADPAAGRAVLLSSHLLAEVEQTCTHAVVVHKGLVVASGRVEEIVGDSPSVQVDVSDVDTASTVLGGLPGIRSVQPDGNGALVVDINGTSRAAVVAALVGAGVGVDRVVPRRRLEDAFLSLVGGDTKASGER
jgi:ABC-2 type transport system ATP-binding protein